MRMRWYICLSHYMELMFYGQARSLYASVRPCTSTTMFGEKQRMVNGESIIGRGKRSRGDSEEGWPRHLLRSAGVISGSFAWKKM